MQPVVLGADGRDGDDGRDGVRGRDGMSRGADGRDGGAASPAERGQDAGSVRLLLERESIGHSTPSGSGGSPLEPARDIEVSAVGGDGGNGGRGGDGGDGARGRSGRDATERSSGTDGGPGGDGGDGGRGSDGGDGGHGGEISIRVAEADTYLLMAVRGADAPGPLVAGGKGGDAGRHGRGGSGGPGGRGGGSHTWTERERNADGTTTTRTHRNSGGSRGRRGSSGRTPTTPLHRGADGADGRFSIEVLGAAGRTNTYPARYDLVLEGFAFAEAEGPDADDIYEPGETIVVSRLTVRNVGSMPTPAHQRVRVTLERREWVSPTADELFLSRSLAPGESCTLDGILRFVIPRPRIFEPADPFAREGRIAPAAEQLGPERPGVAAGATPFRRRYPHVDLERPFVTQFPVANHTDVRVLKSLAPGERSHFHFSVDNISSSAIGAASARRRAVRVQVEYVAGDIDVHDLIFVGADGTTHVLEDTPGPDSGYIVDIPEIGAGERVDVTGVVGFRDGCPAYAGATLEVTLWLESLARGGKLEIVQRRRATLRVEHGYRETEASRAVLLTHNNVSREAYQAWNALLDQRLGLPADDWSMARYGHFDHATVLPDGRNLRGHIDDKLVIVLNNAFNPRSDAEEELPTDYLRGKDVRESVTTNGNRFLVVGPHAFALREWLEPNSELRLSGDDFDDPARYLESVRGSADTYTEETFRDDITAHWDLVTVSRPWWPFARPSAADRIQKFARWMMKKLARLHPHRRYVIILRTAEAAERVGRWMGILPRWHYGRLEIRRSLNLETNTAVALVADADQMNDVDFIAGTDARFALLLALSFEHKLALTNDLLRRSSSEPAAAETLELVVETMLVDLAEEQASARRARFELSDEQLAERLPNLRRLVEEPLATLIDDQSPAWNALFDLAAGLETIARSQKAWWMLWGRNKALTRHTLGLLERFRTETFASYAIDMDGDVAMGLARAGEAIADRVELLRDRIRRLVGFFARTFSTGQARRVALLHFRHTGPIGRNVEREIDEWTEPESRILSAEAFAGARDAETDRLARQAALREMNEADRSEMLVPAAEPQRRAAPEARAVEVQEASTSRSG